VLDGSASSDPNQLPLVYQWTQRSGPPVAIHGSETAQASFDPPTPGTYSFQLGTSDWIFSSSATVTVNVAKEDVPVAVATAPSVAYVGDSIVLDGSASHDPLNVPLTFSWTQVSGPPASLGETTSPKPTFVPAANGTYVFQLQVANNETTSAPAMVSIPVQHFPLLSGGGCTEAPGPGLFAALILLEWILSRRRTARFPKTVQKQTAW
jgi:hypothetical protein